MDSACYTREGRDTLFYATEVKPHYLAGDRELFKYLSNTIRYPKYEREHKFEGTVLVDFVVERDGSVTHIVARKGKEAKALVEEALRVVKGMGKWAPGQSDGENVTMKFTLPIRFRTLL